MQKWYHKQSEKYISKVSVGFVKCYEWHIACNRPTLACPRKIAAAKLLKSRCGWPLSPAVSLWRQNYTGICLHCQSYQGTVELTSVDCLLWYAMRQYWCYFDWHHHQETVRLSVSNLPPPSSPSFTAQLNGPLWRHDNRKIFDFKQTIIDFQEKTILTSLV